MALSLPNYPTDAKLKFNNLGEIISGILPYILVLSGIAMMFLLISGGFKIMTSMGDLGKVKMGYGRITAAIIGFIIIFTSYLIVQTIEKMLGVKIL